MTNLRVNVDSRMMIYSERKRKGGDPSLFFEILEGAIKRQDWEYLTDDGGTPLGSFTRFIEAPYPIGCGLKRETLLALLSIEHRDADENKIIKQRMEALRITAVRLLDEEHPTLAKQGRPRKDNNIIFSPERQGTDPDYILSRLKRDRPDLARQVIDKKVSANAAAIEAGIYPAKISVNLKDMSSAARTLASRLDADQIDELIAQLREHRG